MQDSKQIEFIAERVVSEVLSRHLPEIRQEMVRRVMAELPAAATGEGGAASAVLEAAMAALQDVTSQADILNVLLDFAARFSGRVALFVVRGESATIWQARGFPDDNGLRNFNLNLADPVVARVVQERIPGAAGLDFDPNFLAKVGHAAGGNAILLPLVLRDKVSALVYGDCGLEGGKLDVAALKLMMRSAGMWLEVLSLRKALGGTAAPEPAPQPAQNPTPQSARATVTAAPVTHERAAAVVAASEAAPAAARSATAVATPEVQVREEEREVHMRAQRFARLLVDEIKLYNQSKVKEGRAGRDLYDRLKEDIEKSRASYNRRYGSSPAATGDYFTKELIRILADNDVSLLGASFPG
jgi:pyruvate/2-oxoglutarate dehydrogenase complex dihydrolipoamide acyltransferase (E2) component